MTGLNKLIKQIGSARKLASMLRNEQGKPISPMAISQWQKRGVPANRAVELSDLSDPYIAPEEFNESHRSKRVV